MYGYIKDAHVPKDWNHNHHGALVDQIKEYGACWDCPDNQCYIKYNAANQMMILCYSGLD